MGLPPKYIKKAEVRNNTGNVISVKVKYGHEDFEADGHDFILVEKEIQPNESVAFEEKEFNMGSFTCVAAVHTIYAKFAGEDGAPVFHKANPDRMIGTQVFHIVDRTGDMAIELGETH